jgi:hypothetical protein
MGIARSDRPWLSSIHGRCAAETGTYDQGEWIVDLDRRQIAVTPDRVLIGQDETIHVQRIRTGRRTKSDPASRIYALLRRGVAARYRGRPISEAAIARGETTFAPTLDFPCVITQ